MQALESFLLVALLGLLIEGCLAREEFVAMGAEQKKTYIVFMSKLEKPTLFVKHAHWYTSVVNSASKSARMMYAYRGVVNGFSARLLPAEAKLLGEKRGVISVLQERMYHIQTTRTPEFLGLGAPFETTAEEWKSASEVIVGVFDFGARYFWKGYEAAQGPIDENMESKSPADDEGHGTHTASTAAGSLVEDANLFDYAKGTAWGMAVDSRIAVYKVCWSDGCAGSDILAAMDQALEDGVDIFSLSIGAEQQANFYNDPVTIGAFGAMEKGIPVLTSAGNSGPRFSTVVNSAPWLVRWILFMTHRLVLPWI